MTTGPDSDEAGDSGERRRRPLFDPIGRLADVVVPTVAHAVDVDDVVRRIDVDDVVHRIDVDALVARLDVNELLGRADVEALVARIDLDDLLTRLDVDGLVSRLDLEALLGRIDVDGLVSRIDVDALLGRIDPNALLDRIDVDRLLDRVDPDRLLDRVDPDPLLDRVDIERLLGRVDVDALLARVDVDAIIDRVDVDRVVQRADLAGVVADSTRGITARTLDLVRRQVAGIDEVITRVGARLVHRDPAADPGGPPKLRELTLPTARERERPSITGQYAGPVARTAALVVDWTTMVFLFGAFTALASWVLGVLTGGDGVDISVDPIWSALGFFGWAFLYFAIPLALTGRTPAKSLVGLRVVGRDGDPLKVRQAVVRVLVLPLSFLLLGLGLIGAVFGRRRRTLHDLAAGSVEVIDWGDRPAALPTPLNNWLEQHQRGSGSPSSAD